MFARVCADVFKRIRAKAPGHRKVGSVSVSPDDGVIPRTTIDYVAAAVAGQFIVA